MGRGDFKQRVIFEVDDQASAPVGKIQGTFGKLGSFLSSRFAITLGDVVGLFKSVAGAAGSVIDAAQQQEKSVAALDQALGELEAGSGRRFRSASSTSRSARGHYPIRR